MFRYLASFVLVFSIVVIAVADEAQREWKDAAGKVLAKGEFVSLMDGEVCILTSEGAGKTIPLENLCPDDQKFAKANGGDLAEIEGKMPEAEEIGAKAPRERSAPAAPSLPSAKAEPNPDLDIIGNDVIAESGGGIDVTATGDIQQKVKDEADKYEGQKRVVMFDFESLWDQNRASDYGGIMGNMFWMKLNREKGFIIPESMMDVRSICELHGIKPNPETPMEQMKQWVTKTFNSDIGIWGKIERVDEDVMEIYDFWLKVVDFSVEPPKVIYEVSRARTEAVAEVTGIYVRAAMDKLYDRKGRTAREKAEMDAMWEANPNLMEGGDFEKVSGGIPAGWETRCAQHREPIGRLVKRVPDPDNPDNHFLHMEMDAEIAEGFGLMYYSKPFPIEETATYRISYRWRKSKGTKLIVFVKCYDTIDTAFKPTPDALKEGFTDRLGSQTREVYRSQQNHWEGPYDTWVEHVQEFTPRHTRFSPKLGRVMVYGYFTAGNFDWDDFVLKKVKDQDLDELRAKVRRHSLDSKVTLKDMEENERRGAETRQQIKKEREEGPGEEKRKTKLK